MPVVAIALGSNIGDRLGNLRKALRMMKMAGMQVTDRSDVFETSPVGPVKQGRFLNACVLCKTSLTPQNLLTELKNIEKRLGRSRGEKWGPREIDLDILLYDDLVCKSEVLTIPHQELHKRDFVLHPLVQIAPNWIHPLMKVSISDIKRDLSDVDPTLVRITRL